MPDWLTYRLSDLLLFSPRTYYRMFELYHQEIWPAQLIAAGLVVAVFVLLRRNDARSSSIIAALLAMCWLWVAIAFHVRRYAPINWAARYFAMLFVLQAALLIWSAVRQGARFGPRPDGVRWLAPVLFMATVVAPPLAGRAAGRGWGQVELVGLTPDATAVATLGLLLVMSPRAPRMLMLVPIAWCAIGGATLWALESSEAWVPIVAGAVGLLAMVRMRRVAM